VLVLICEAVTFWMGNNTNDIAMKNNVAKTACLQTQVCVLWFGLWLCDLTIFMLLFQLGVENSLPFMRKLGNLEIEAWVILLKLHHFSHSDAGRNCEYDWLFCS